MRGYESFEGWDKHESSDIPLDDTVKDPSVKHKVKVGPKSIRNSRSKKRKSINICTYYFRLLRTIARNRECYIASL